MAIQSKATGQLPNARHGECLVSGVARNRSSGVFLLASGPRRGEEQRAGGRRKRDEQRDVTKADSLMRLLKPQERSSICAARNEGTLLIFFFKSTSKCSLRDLSQQHCPCVDTVIKVPAQAKRQIKHVAFGHKLPRSQASYIRNDHY